MRLLIQSAMIFFGTLMAAGLLALGEPRLAALTVSDEAGSSILLPLQGLWPDGAASPGR